MSFVVTSKVKFPAQRQAAVHQVAAEMMAVAKQQPGLIHVAFHQASDDYMTMMYWEWRCQADHEACMQQPAWGAILSASEPLLQTTEVLFETFERLS